MSGFQFPPPASESGDGWEDVDYPTADRGGRFILPPPRRAPGGDVDEVAQRISDEISWIRNTARDAGLGVEGLEQEVHNLGTVVADYGDALERKVEPWAVPTIAPLSQTINRRADPVFGLSDFMIPPVHGEDAASGLQSGGNTKGRIYMAFITPALNRAYEQLNFFVSAVTNPCRMDVALYLVDPDTKVFTRQTLVTDATVPLGESVASVTFDRWVATQGSYICIAWLQHGSGNSRYLLGLNDTPRPLTNAIFPRKISAIHTSTGVTSLPATINGETQADFSFWFTPYAELSENIGINYRVFSEGWGHISAAPRPWVQVGRDTIRSLQGFAQIEASGSKRGAIMYDTPLSTDYGRVRTRIHRIWPSGSSHTVLAIRATNDLRSGIGLAFNRHNYFLIEWSSVSPNNIWDSSTTLLTVGIAPSEGHQIEVDYLDGMVTARINGTPIIAEHPVGGPQGSAGRFLGIYMRRTSELFVNYQSPTIGPWSARDLPQDDGDEDDGDGDDSEDEG